MQTKEITDNLLTLGLDVKVIDTIESPRQTSYILKVSDNTKATKLLRSKIDIAQRLGVFDRLSLAQIPSTPYINLGIYKEVPETLLYSDIIRDINLNGLEAPLIIGRDTNDQLILKDLAHMPHMLVAGQSGSGKSVFLNVQICTLLQKAKQSNNLELVLIDMKQVEMSQYEKCKNVKCSYNITTGSYQLLNAIQTMEDRYELFSKHDCKNLAEYNFYCNKNLKRIVIVVDELAEFIMMGGNHIKNQLTHIAQKGRAAGIHLILATQRPTVNVVDGLIKANIPVRVAFSLPSWTDSKVILDCKGAESLLGNGDMLFKDGISMSPQRIQGFYINSKDIEGEIL